MANPQANDVRCSAWFRVACGVFRVAGEGEGASSPKAGEGEAGESFAEETKSGRHVYFVGAMGETSLRKVQYFKTTRLA